MKIEPGDLCVTVRPDAMPHARANAGRLVTADSFLGATAIGPSVWQCTCLGEPLVDAVGGKFPRPMIDAKNLRPLRDGPGADESTTWAGLPIKLVAPEKETA